MILKKIDKKNIALHILIMSKRWIVIIKNKFSKVFWKCFQKLIFKLFIRCSLKTIESM